MPRLIFVIGPGASGKSWFMEEHFKGRDLTLLNVYDYQQRAYDEAGAGKKVPYGLMFRCLTRANAALMEDVGAALAAGRDVAVEHTLFRAKRRIACLDAVSGIPDVTAEVYVMCPSEALWRSNAEKRGMDFGSLQGEARDMEFPNVSEGFGAIYEVADGEVRLRMDPPKPELPDQARRELAEEAEQLRREDEAAQARKALLESMKTRKFWHYCEACGKKALLTSREAFEAGWDYPPEVGDFGLLGPRTCGDCGLDSTLFWRVQTGGGLPIVIESALTPEELVTWRRIKGEPESLLEEEP